MTIETVLWWGVLIAFINTFLIVRHTRHNEEIGAQELLLSGRVHRAAPLLSVLIVALLVNVLIAVGVGAGMVFVDVPWSSESTWLYGVAFGMFGFVWASLAAVVVQLFQSGRTANSVLAMLIGVAFVLRGIGDFMGRLDASGVLQPSWVSMLSPFGWMQATRALTLPDWQPLLWSVICIAVAIPVAFVLLSKRDVGASIVPPRKGRARARTWLKTPLGLAWYLQRTVFIGWLVATILMVVTIGVLVPEMTHVYESSESMKAMIVAMGGSGALVPAFLSAMLSIVALMVVGYVLQALGRLRSEEASGHLEAVLATRVSRMGWLVFHSLVVLIGGAVMLLSAGVLLGAMVNISSDFTVSIGAYAAAGLSYWPLLLLFACSYVLLFGVLPRLAGMVMWLYFGFVVFMSWLAPLLQLDQWVMNLSPVEHMVAVPAENIEVVPMVVIVVVAVAFGAVGMVLWRRRNLLER